MAPEKSSASPARITSLELPRDDRPAQRAKGTVRPSLKPRIKSRRRGLGGDGEVQGWEVMVVVVLGTMGRSAVLGLL